jgi:hypothetical protein
MRYCGQGTGRRMGQDSLALPFGPVGLGLSSTLGAPGSGDPGARRDGRATRPPAYRMESVPPVCRADNRIHQHVRELQAAMPAGWIGAVKAGLDTARRTTEPLAAMVALMLLDIAAAFAPSYRPTTRSTVTPYVGHCLAFVRMTVDLRPLSLLHSFTDSLRFLVS